MDGREGRRWGEEEEEERVLEEEEDGKGDRDCGGIFILVFL